MVPWSQFRQILAFRTYKKSLLDALINKLCVEKINKIKELIEDIQSFFILKTNKT